MPDYFDAKAFSKTLRSYNAALKRILEISPTVSMGTSDYNWRAHMPRNLEGWLSESKIHLANDMFINGSDLFEYGRPKIIGRNTWVWSCDFFRVTFYRKETWDWFGWEAASRGRCAYTDDDGEAHAAIPDRAARLVPHPQAMRLKMSELHYGLGGWEETIQKKAKPLSRKLSPEIREKFVEAIEKKTAEVKKWRDAINELSQAMVQG